MTNPYRKIRYAVAAIIRAHGKYLLAQRMKILTKDGSLVPTVPEWDLVKGGIESGESPRDAMFREIFEEIGSKSHSIIKQFNETIDFDFPEHLREKNGFDSQQTTIFLVEFLGRVSDLHPADSEIGGYALVTKEELLQRIVLPETHAFIEKHLEEI